jgi:hypothetical protein
MRRERVFLLFSLATVALVACDKEPTKLEQMTSAQPSASAPPTVSAEPPAKPTKPVITIEESSADVGGDRVDFAAPDLKGRLGVALGSKPVAGEEITVIAARNVKVPNVAATFSSLAFAKAKSVLLKTQRRDGVTAEVPFALAPRRVDCAAVGFIAKDGAINAWPISGGAAARFNHGMAGPDMTRGTEGVRKLVTACDVPWFAVGGDDSVTWGLLVDLALGVMSPGDAGAPPKGKSVVLLSKPVPGHKVDELE